jgi:hypothetical protein
MHVHASIERIEEIFEGIIAADFTDRNIRENPVVNLVESAPVAAFVGLSVDELIMTKISC